MHTDRQIGYVFWVGGLGSPTPVKSSRVFLVDDFGFGFGFGFGAGFGFGFALGFGLALDFGFGFGFGVDFGGPGLTAGCGIG